MHSRRIAGFTAGPPFIGAGSSGFYMPPRTGPKDGGDVLPYVKVVSYDPRWPTIYQVEKQRILMLVGSLIVGIEHFGSTSIPRMCAKPVIDILCGLRKWEQSTYVRTILARLDYQYIAGLEEDWAILGRTGSPAFRLHLVPYGTFRWYGFLALRNYIGSNPRVASEYCRRKKHLAVTHRSDRISYSQGKRDFLDNLEDLARANILASRLVSRQYPLIL
jgi:GrpB-like predicted nucleotidyltransferase (UPF0157 family)